MERCCLECGASIEGRPANTKYCNARCKVEFNREAVRASGRLTKARARAKWTTEQKAEQYVKVREWQKAHPEALKRYAREDYLRHTEKRVEKGKRWRAENPEAQRRNWIRSRDLRRARQRSADSRAVTNDERAGVLLANDGLCLYCNASPAVEVDHIVPLARGGRHAIGNLAPSCGPCNRSKAALLLMEWRLKRAVEAEVRGGVSASGLVCA